MRKAGSVKAFSAFFMCPVSHTFPAYNGNVMPRRVSTGDACAPFYGLRKLFFLCGLLRQFARVYESSGSKSSSKQKKLSTISLSTGRDNMRSVPTAPKMTTSRAKSISLPTVKSITKSALSGSTSGVSTPTVGGIQSRVSREGGDVRFIKL